ncbi:MAG: hypothetical protein ACI4OY_07275 [Aristaeellaceae bacterium]
MKSQEVLHQLEQLQDTANKAMGGLEADRRLMLRIERAAAQPPQPQRRKKTWAPALACAMALVVCVAVAVPMLRQPPQESLITSQAAGSGTVGNERALLNMAEDSVSITQNGATPEYRSLWAEGSGTFPLIGVDGRYYRMMTSPAAVSDSLLGNSLGTVAEFTTEPSLSGGNVLLSNAVAFGTEVYEISGMGGTLVAAEVDGSMRLFQRVSFNGSALRGSETLSDTLQISGHVAGMELSDVGTITDADACEQLLSTLLDCATYESSGSVSGRQSLLISLDNGLTVQLAVRDENLSACGTWSCPEFFEAFEDALQ